VYLPAILICIQNEKWNANIHFPFSSDDKMKNRIWVFMIHFLVFIVYGKWKMDVHIQLSIFHFECK